MAVSIREVEGLKRENKRMRIEMQRIMRDTGMVVGGGEGMEGREEIRTPMTHVGQVEEEDGEEEDEEEKPYSSAS
jgi:hypothetical protein